VLCLLRTPIRFVGAALLIASTIWAGRPSLPDIRISPEGNMVSVRNADGRLSIMKSRNDDFTVKEWLAADGDARAPRDESLSANIRCDGEGCIATLPDQSLIALSLTAEALAEDCSKAALVVTTRSAPAGCAAFVVDRNEWRVSGAIDITRAGKSFGVIRANPEGHDRPWARRPQTRDRTAPAPADQPALRDATPRSEDVEAGEP
jgi:competence protein ComEC